MQQSIMFHLVLALPEKKSGFTIKSPAVDLSTIGLAISEDAKQTLLKFKINGHALTS